MLGSAAGAAAAAPRHLSFALDGYVGGALKLQVAIEVPAHPSIVLTCPPRCTVAFGPGTRIPSPVSYHIGDETVGSPEYGAYVLAVGSSYDVLGYGSCQHPDLSDPVNSRCAGTASRSTTVRVHLQYRPLVTLIATGTILDPRPAYYTGVTMDAQDANVQNGDSADCMFTITAVSGDRCRFRLNPGPVNVTTSDGGYLYNFAGYSGAPCAGQEIGAPTQHGCAFTLGATDVTIHATVTAPPDATRVAPLDSNLPAPPPYRAPAGPPVPDFATDPTSTALDQVLNNLFDLQYGPGSVPLTIFTTLAKGTGVFVTGSAVGGRGASATAASPPLFSGRLRAAGDELAPLTVTLTPAGRRLFARRGRHRVRITATYTPAAGAPVSKSRSGQVRS